MTDEHSPVSLTDRLRKLVRVQRHGVSYVADDCISVAAAVMEAADELDRLNALIVAAVNERAELVAALTNLCDWCDKHANTQQFYVDSLATLVKVARAALARAAGEG